MKPTPPLPPGSTPRQIHSAFHESPIPDISRDLFDLTGYCSIVTGASVGIGLNIAEALAYRGSDLVLVSRNAERLEEAAGKVRAIGRRAVAVAADVADDDAPERIVEAALGLGRRIDVLVNNAGFMTFADPSMSTTRRGTRFLT